MVRLNRIYSGSLVKPATSTVLVPRPLTKPIGGQPIRDLELLAWATVVIDTVLDPTT